jgi:2-amino-4-hydroxy-6-hydroxymethyldihydropteridine diphosphokinase
VSGVATAAWIALGSNLGDRRAHLASAVAELDRSPGIRALAVSSFVETEPVGGPRGQPRFLNAAAALETTLSARELFATLQAIERAHGRDRAREVKNGPRTLDLDLLIYGDARIDEPDLCVPHPRLEERAFVLLPLSEIAPDLVLPRCRSSVVRRLADLATRAARPRDALAP